MAKKNSTVEKKAWNKFNNQLIELRSSQKENDKKQTIAVWFSCGAASAVASKLAIEKYGQSCNVIIVNNPVLNEHPDNIRFLKDCEIWFGQKVITAINSKFPSTDITDVFAKKKYMSGVHGAPCTVALKKEARYQFEKENQIHWHVLGFTVDEQTRSDRFIKYERENLIPILINENLSKMECFEILINAGIDLPEIYNLGYPNANCIGCVKSQSPSYWNLVRKTFPDVFEARAVQSRKLGARLVVRKGKRIFLDELLSSDIGGKIKSWECGIFCETDTNSLIINKKQK